MKQCKLAVPVGTQAARLLARQAYETRSFLGVGTPAPIEGSAADRDEWGLGDLETLGMRAQQRADPGFVRVAVHSQATAAPG